MARLGSSLVGGHFPLDEDFRPLLANLFKPAGKPARILDPFSGEAETVQYLAETLNMKPYTIEVEEKWGKLAQEKFGPQQALIDDSYEVTISNYSFPIVYCNPPYDTDMVGDGLYGNRRAEYRALKHFFTKVQETGYMIWVAYAHHMTAAVFDVFFNNCSAVDIYRFPRLHLDHYHQVAIVGKFIRNKAKIDNELQIEQMRNAFVGLGKNPEKIRDISLGVRKPKGSPEDFDPRYDIPATTSLIRNFTFVPKKIDPEAFLKLHEQFGAHHLPAFAKALETPQEETQNPPIATPRPGQLAVVMASGMMDGIKIVHNGKRAILRGSVKRVVELVSEETGEDKNGYETKTEKYHDRPQSQIVILYEDGQCENISTDEQLVDFIEVHGDELMHYFETMYKPAYDMTIDDIWVENYDRMKVKGQFNLIPTQEYVATAITEHLMRNPTAIIVGEPSVGKAQPLDAKVMTPSGWKTIGSLWVGDEITDPVNGKTTKVVGVYPQGEKPIYRVTFRDGASTECCEDHLWQVTTPEARLRGHKPKVMSLREISKGYIGQDGRQRYKIPLTAPVIFEEKAKLPIDPYLLGVILGDGNISDLSRVKFSSADEEIIESVVNSVPHGVTVKHDNKYDYRITHNMRNKGSENELVSELRNLKLMGSNSYTKHIPRVYLRASIEDRISLLQGLLDTDGSANSNEKRWAGSIDFCTTSKSLALNIQELVCSLGGSARIKEKNPTYTYEGEKKNGALAYRVTILLPESIDPFRLTRKLSLYRTGKRQRVYHSRSFSSIEYVGEKESVCIKVDSPHQLYITDDYIVTHNTAQATAVIANLKTLDNLKSDNSPKLNSVLSAYNAELKQISGIAPGEVVIIVCPANLPSKWKEEIELMYPEAIVRILENITDARILFEDAQNRSEHIYIGITTYERAKLAEGWEAAYQVQNIRTRIPYMEDGERKERIETVGKAIDPTTGARVKMWQSGGWVDMPLNKVESRPRLYEGNIFDGYQKLEGGKRKQLTKNGIVEYTQVYKKIEEVHGHALYHMKRSFGLPKIGNGRVATKVEEVILPAREFRQVRYDKFTGEATHVETVTTKPRVIERVVYDYNLIQDEPVLDPWLATKGIRCFESSSKKNKVDKALNAKGLKYYRVGTGHKDLDEMLKEVGVTTYYANEGGRVPRNPRYPIAEFISRRYKGRVGLLITDEIHRTAGMDTDVGQATRKLIYASKKILGLTGTLYGGVASSIYAIEFAVNPRVRKKFPWPSSTPIHWISKMGVLEDVFETKASYEDGYFTGYKRYPKVQNKEVAGASPLLVRELLDHCVFVGLRDLGTAMVPFKEHPIETEMDDTMTAVYDMAYRELKEYNAKCIMQGDGSFTGSYYRNILQLPDAMHRDNEVFHRTCMDRDARKKHYVSNSVMVIPAVGDYVKPKEDELSKMLKEVIGRGDRAIVYMSQTATRDIQDRIMDEVIKPNVPGAKPFILRSSVQADDRVTYVQKRVEDGHNILICNPKLVAEGVDLVDFNVIFFIEIEPSLRVMGQASRRTWRLNQTKPCDVYYLYYNDIFQNAATFSIADKTAAANVLYGNEGGNLSDLSNNSDFYSQVAKIVESGAKKSKEDIKDKFNSAAYTAEDYHSSSWYAPPRRKRLVKVVVNNPEFEDIIDQVGELIDIGELM